MWSGKWSLWSVIKSKVWSVKWVVGIVECKVQSVGSKV